MPTGGAEAGRTIREDNGITGRDSSVRTRLLFLLVVTGAQAIAGAAFAGVVQEVEVVYTPPVGPEDRQSRQVFGLSSTDITADISAAIGSPGAGGPGSFAAAAAGRFSDPFTLDGEPNPLVSMAIDFQPVPLPAELPFVLSGIAALGVLGRRLGRVTHGASVCL